MHAKSDAETIAVRPVMDLPNVTLLTGAEVLSLETGSGGRVVTGVVVSRGGQREVYQGDIVALSAGATNSARAHRDGQRHPRRRARRGPPRLITRWG